MPGENLWGGEYSCRRICRIAGPLRVSDRKVSNPTLGSQDTHVQASCAKLRAVTQLSQNLPAGTNSQSQPRRLTLKLTRQQPTSLRQLQVLGLSKRSKMDFCLLLLCKAHPRDWIVFSSGSENLCGSGGGPRCSDIGTPDQTPVRGTAP